MAANNFTSREKFPVVDEYGIVSKKPYQTPTSGPYDEYYIDIEVIEVPKPVEGSEDDYILVLKKKESKRSIREVIDSQADDVGLDNIMKKFALTGDPSVLPSPVKATDEVIDLTKLPSDSAEYLDYIHNIHAAYMSLPIELRQDMSLEDFVKNINQDKVNSYLKSVKDADEHKGDK